MQESKATGHMRAEDRRELILSKACHLFYQYGYDAVTTKQLAQEVGCSEGLLFRHFALKNDIYLAPMKEWEDSVTQPVELPIVDSSALKTLEKMYQDAVVNRSWNKNAKIRKNLEVAGLPFHTSVFLGFPFFCNMSDDFYIFIITCSIFLLSAISF